MSMTDDFDVDADSDLGFTPAVADAPGKVGVEQRPTKRRGALRRKLSSIAVLIAALSIVGGSYALLAPSSGADDSAISPADIAKGRQLYETSCITCHGANLQGVKDRGPSLIGVGQAATYFQVSTGRMPATSQGPNNLRKTARFTDEETRLIAAYVESVGGGPQIPSGNLRGDSSSLAEGGELFRLNCASCHGATADGAPLSAGKIAPGLHDSTDAQIYAAMLSGPENMPVFSDNQITPEQKRAIIAYVQYLNASKDPGGFGLGRLGPVTEGLLVWTAGLGLLIGSILWIGARS
jgi:ubiquinol-cytochrome c reductase cytochrome c subunit